jgi:two-component system cell cycle sensor histidine kinase/response regulator CckA
MSESIRVLHVEASPLDREAVRDVLENHPGGFQVDEAASREESEALVAEGGYDVVLSGLHIPGLDGLQVIRRVQAADPHTPVIIVTGRGSEEVAVQAMKRGAADYVVNNPDRIRQLPQRIQKVVQETRLEHQRQRAQETLRENEARYRAVVETQAEAVCRWLPDTTMTFVNEACCTYYGKTREELLGQQWLPFVAEHDRQHVWETCQSLVAHPRPNESEEEVRSADGRSRWWLWTDSPIVGAEGRVVEILSVGRDITERKRADRHLRALNEAALAMERALTTEGILNAMAQQLRHLGFTCGVFLLDESRTRLFAKYLSHDPRALQAVEKLAGLSREDLFVSVGDVDMFRRAIQERQAVFVGRAEEIVRGALPRPLKGLAGRIASTLKVSRCIGAPLMIEDEVIGVLAVQADDLTEADVPAITAFAHQIAAAWRKATLLQDLQDSLGELKQTQAQLVLAQRRETLGRLASGVAHDFNNLLTAIMGFAQLLQNEMAADDPQRMDMQEILRASQRAASLTRQLLSFSRRQTLEPCVLDLNELITDTGKMLRRLIGEDMDLVMALEPAAERVRGDPGQIEQVIMNLVVNARDAMPQGGRLAIRTDNVVLAEEACAHIPEARPGRFVRLSVVDTGVGMDEETLQHLFEPFFTTKGPEGTGLGLSVVYGIVAQHGGWVDVSTRLGQGSTFSVYLPTYSEEKHTELSEDTSLACPVGNGEGILLVEDDPAASVSTARILREGGYLVFEAASVAEALDVFGEERRAIHLVLSDMVLPDGTGLQLIDRLLSRGEDVKVLISSGYADSRSQWCTVSERALPFVHKPYTLPELLRAVREAMVSS